ncbi:hypothetical protein T08_16347 [Trichinella sp. T8]|nr:hypothetical protein T08_16347 [Trichinella sp. T8]
MCNVIQTNKEMKSGINELCEMANMPGVGLEIYNAGGGWRDQKWAPSWSVKLPSLRQGRVQTLPCSLGRQSARSSSLERGKPRLSALKRRMCGEFSAFPRSKGRGDCAFCLPNRVGEILSCHDYRVEIVQDGHARAKEADGCAILKRVAMMKTELRRLFNSRIWPKYYENMALKTTDTREKAPTMEESVGQKKIRH